MLAFGWAGTSLGIITNTLGLWFDEKRGMAISLALNGASFGGIVGVPLLVAGIGYFGFPGAMMVAAIVMIVLMVPVILIFVGQAAGAGAYCGSGRARMHHRRRRFGRRAFRDIAFLSVSAAFALVLFAQVGFIVHLITFLDDVIGRERAAVAVALLTAMAVVGRVLFSFVIDRMNQRLASSLSFISQAVALVIVINVRNDVALIAACALFGFSVGNLITLPALIVQREFDPRSFGVLVSLITAINQITYAFGPGVIGLLRDISGSYALPFYCCIGVELTAAVLIMIRGRRAQTVILSEPLRQIRHLSVRQAELKRVQRHRHQRVVAAQPDHLDHAALGRHLDGLIIEALRHAAAFMQRLGEVEIITLPLGSSKIGVRRSRMSSMICASMPPFSANRLWANHS